MKLCYNRVNSDWLTVIGSMTSLALPNDASMVFRCVYMWLTGSPYACDEYYALVALFWPFVFTLVLSFLVSLVFWWRGICDCTET